MSNNIEHQAFWQDKKERHFTCEIKPDYTQSNKVFELLTNSPIYIMDITTGEWHKFEQ